MAAPEGDDGGSVPEQAGRRPLLVSALFDLARRDGTPRRTVQQYLVAADAVCSVQAPLVVFADPELCAPLRACRQRASATAGFWLVPLPFEELPETRHVPAIRRLLAMGHRNATVASVTKDTARYVALTWSKLGLMERALQVTADDDVEPPDVVAWIDLGLPNVLCLPAGSTVGELVGGAPDGLCGTRLTALDEAGASQEPGYWQHRARPMVAGGFFSLGVSRLDAWRAETATEALRSLDAGWPTLEESLLGTVAARRPGDSSLVDGGHADALVAYAAAVAAPDLDRPRRQLQRLRRHRDPLRRARSARQLLGEPLLPPDVEGRARGEELGDLPTLAELAPSTRIGTLMVTTPPDRVATNPSILPDGDGFVANVRLVNYRIGPGGRYEFPHGDAVVRSDNLLVGLDDDLAVRWSVEVDPTPSPLLAGHGRVHGFEDLRLFRHGGELWALAVVGEATAAARPGIALLAFDDAATLARSLLLASPHPDRVEKNWVPLVTREGAAVVSSGTSGEGERGDRIRVLYGHHPTLVVDVDLLDGSVHPLVQHGTPGLHRFLRGGSQVVADGDGWLTVVHERLTWHRRGTWYQHRIMRLDATLAPVATSAPFRLVGADVEFCSGLAITEDRAVLTAGIQDAHAVVAVVDLDQFRALASRA